MPSLRDFKKSLGILFDGMDRAVAWRFGATNLLAAVGGFMAGLGPLALKGVVDAATGASGRGANSVSAAAFGVAYLLCLCVGRLLAELRPVLASMAEQRLYARLRLRFFQHALELPLAFHLQRRSGGLIHALQQGISGYQIILFNLVNGVVPVLVEGVTVMLVLLSLKQAALTTTFAATAIAYFGTMVWCTAGLSSAAQSVVDAGVDANSILADGLINFEPIKCFGTERWTLNNFARAIGVLEHSWARLQRQRLHSGVAVTAIFALSMSASLMIAIHAVANGTLTVGGFVLANVYMAQVVRPLEMLATATRDVSQGLAFIRPLVDVFDAPPERTWPKIPLAEGGANGVQAGNSTAAPIRLRCAPSISFQDIQLAFDDGEPVLNDFSLYVPAGRSTAIVGASGCGKSSLIRLLLRLCEPDGGRILLDGMAIDTLPIAALRAMIAVVPQDTVLFNTTIAANIAIGREGARRCEIEQAARLARLHEFITALPAGYDTVVGERGLKLSGGERQRIAIARAILRDPLVYVFDEATSMLDGSTELEILHKLREISSDRTTITIAHRLSAVQHVDEIVVLAKGRVAEQGDHATLLARGGVYAAMWCAQHVNGSPAPLS